MKNELAESNTAKIYQENKSNFLKFRSNQHFHNDPILQKNTKIDVINKFYILIIYTNIRIKI
jgi:hypothetical protein